MELPSNCFFVSASKSVRTQIERMLVHIQTSPLHRASAQLPWSCQPRAVYVICDVHTSDVSAIVFTWRAFYDEPLPVNRIDWESPESSQIVEAWCVTKSVLLSRFHLIRKSQPISGRNEVTSHRAVYWTGWWYYVRFCVFFHDNMCIMWQYIIYKSHANSV